MSYVVSPCAIGHRT